MVGSPVEHNPGQRHQIYVFIGNITLFINLVAHQEIEPGVNKYALIVLIIGIVAGHDRRANSEILVDQSFRIPVAHGIQIGISFLRKERSIPCRFSHRTARNWWTSRC